MKANKYFFVLFLLVVFLYGITLFNGYSLDDELVIKDNLKTHQGIKGIPEIFTSHYSDLTHIKFEYRPIVLTTFAIEYSLWGENPFISHLINLLLYALLLIILFKILHWTFKDFSTLYIFLIVVLFAAHPIHTEVVSSLKNRDELLSALFGFLFIYYVLKYIDKQKIFNILLALFFLVLGVLSKKSAFIFPLFLFIILYYSGKTSIKKILLLVIISIIVSISMFIIFKSQITDGHSDRAMFFIENPLVEDKGFIYKFYSMLLTIFFYLKLSIFPHPLAFYYGYNMLSITNVVNWKIVASLIIIIVLLFFVIKGFRKKTKVSFGILFFLIGISIYTNFFKKVPGIVAVRFLNVAILGYVFLLLLLFASIFKIKTSQESLKYSKNLTFILLFIAVFGLYSFKTIRKNYYWKSKLSLFEHDIKYLKNSVKANALLANEYLIEAEKYKNRNENAKAKEFAIKAKKYFLRTLSIYPDYHEVNSNLGFLYLNYFGKPDSAYFYLNRVHSEKKKKVLSLFSQAKEVLSKADTNMAMELFSEILHIDSSYIDAYTPLSKIYFKQGKLKKAVDLNRILIRKNLGSDLPFINIANFYYLHGNIKKGIAYAELALQKNPNNVKVANKISEYYYEKGNPKKGKYYLKMAKKAAIKDSLYNAIIQKK